MPDGNTPSPLARRCRRYASWMLSAITASAVVGGVGAFVVRPLQGTFSGDMQDLGTRGSGVAGAAPGILGGARQVAAGKDPYSPFLRYVPTHQVITAPFDYPPVLAWILRPIAGLPQLWAENVWLWFDLACLVTGCLVVARITLPVAWPWRRIALIAALLFPPATYNLWHGNVNPVVFLCNALALWAWVRGWELRCGVALGVGAAIKLAPAALVVLFIRRRWWRGAIAAGATGLATLLLAAVAVPGPVVREFVQQVVPLLDREDGWYTNQSLAAVLSRLIEHSAFTLDPPVPLLHMVVLLLDVLLLLCAGWAVSTEVRATASRRSVEFGIGVAVMLLVGATTWYAHHVQLLIVLAAAIAWMTEHRRSRRWLLPAVVAVGLADVLAAPLFLNQVAPTLNLVRLQASPWFWPVLQAGSVPAVAVLSLLAAMAAALRRDRARAHGAAMPGRLAP